MGRRRKRKDDDGEHSKLDEGYVGWLLEVETHEVEIDGRTTKRCTGALLFEKFRDTYDQVVDRLAGGASVRTIMREFGLGTHTVLAISRREKLEVATRKTALADALLLGAEVAAERAIEMAGEADSAYEAAGTAKMLAETSNLMRGQATSISAAVHVHVDATAAAKRLADRALEMGLSGGENLALGEGVVIELESVASRPADIPAVVIPAYPADSQGTASPGNGLRNGSGHDEGGEGGAGPENFEGGGGDAPPPAPCGA